MRVKVDESLCCGCGPCSEICSEVFELVDDVSKVKVDVVAPELEDACWEARDNCPTEAISIEE